jgi:hypothetical protein
MFKYSDLNSEEKDNIYQLFYDTYVKSTGTSWSKSKFESRANNWIFLGNDDGFITLRPQINGLFKFTGSAGSIKGVMTGLEQLKSMNIPVWGMMTDKLAHILEMKYGFVRPNKLIIKTLLKFIPKSVFGNTDFTINNDGSITLQYSDVGNATKFFVANKQYYQFLLKNIIPQLPNVPKIVILGIKKIIGINEAINMNNIINEEILNVINEKRSNPEKNVDIGIRDFLLNLLSKYDITDIFVSFRTDTHVTDINPNNRYDTPTGFYAYPLYIYLTEEMINSDDFNIAFFRKLFPYQNQLSHIYFFALKNKTGLIYNNTDKNQLKDYVKKILQLYGHINPVKSLCDDYLNDKYQSTYTSNILNNAHSLWLFLYSVIPYIMGNNNDNKVTAVTNLCRRIGINGFIDDKTSGYIHPNEKNQAVFFRVKTIGNVFIFNQPKINKYNLQDKSNYDGDIIQKVTDNLYTWYPPNSDYKYLLNKDFKQINPKLRIFFNKEPKYNFMVIMGENKKYNYVDLNGKLLSPNMWFDDADNFDKNGFAVVKKDKQWNFINTDGKILSPNMWFDNVNAFYNNGFAKVEKDNQWNFINTDGKILSPMWFDNVYAFNKNGFAVVKKDKQWNFINTDGKILFTNMWFDDIYGFYDNGFVKVKKDNKHNFINTDGKILSPMWFDNVYAFNNNGIAKVEKDNQWNFINTDGKILFPMWFDNVYNVYYFNNNGFAKVEKDNQWNFINTDGKILSPNMWFDDADYFDNEFARIRKDEKVNFINTEGKLMSDVWFDKASLFSSNGFSEVTKDNKINFLKKDGNLLSPNIWFDEVGFFNKGNDLVPVKINHTVYYINGNNGNFYNNNYEPISPPTNGGEKKSTINEIILEEVQNLFEEVLKYKIRSDNGNFFDVYKNPPHIKKMSNNIRGITTPNYDLYVVDDTTPHKEILHTDIRRYLSTHEGLPSNFDYNGGTQGYYAWIKVPNSDGMTLTFDTINNKINNKIDDEFLKEYIENLNEEHPYIKFYGA